MQPIESERQAEMLQAQVLEGRDYGPRVLKLVGGPKDGSIHEIESGWPCPDRIGEPVGDGQIAWYEVVNLSEALFVNIE